MIATAVAGVSERVSQTACGVSLLALRPKSGEVRKGDLLRASPRERAVLPRV